MKSRRSWSIGIVAAMLGSLLALGAPTAGATSVRYDLTLWDDCFSGTGPASKLLTFDLRRPNGTLAERVSDKTDASGRFAACFNPNYIISGWTLVAKRGTTRLRTFTIPTVTVATDRGDDTVKGRAPAGKRVTVSVRDCTSDPTTCTTVLARRLTASTKGRYALDVTGDFDAVGQDLAVARIRTGAGDTITRSVPFPYFYAWPSLNLVVVYAKAGSAIGAQQLDGPSGPVAQTATVTIGPDGDGLWNLLTEPGDRFVVGIEADAILDLPDVSVDWVPATNVTEGVCLPSRPVVITLLSAVGTWAVDADETGAYALDLDDVGGPGSLTGLGVQIRCSTVAGDHVFAAKNL
jgi:hypothetical protein